MGCEHHGSNCQTNGNEITVGDHLNSVRNTRFIRVS
jgi:hypothetical protein